ncbi:MAG TPA: NAD(P)-binding domain-containing protein, partial [Cytophagales bacterium]
MHWKVAPGRATFFVNLGTTSPTPAPMHYSVSLIGTGNVAWHLSQALEKAGHQVREIYGRNPEHAERVAEKLYDAQVVTSLDFSESEATVFLLCISDDAIGRVADQVILPGEDAVLCHTSGTQPLDLLAGRSHAGVFYPLQTFTRNHRLDLSAVPFCI